MAKFEIKFEKELKKQVNEVVRKKQKEIILQRNKVRICKDGRVVIINEQI